eukprot:4078095-Prorocentrum_lima.AAC.1
MCIRDRVKEVGVAARLGVRVSCAQPVVGVVQFRNRRGEHLRSDVGYGHSLGVRWRNAAGLREAGRFPRFLTR